MAGRLADMVIRRFMVQIVLLCLSVVSVSAERLETWGLAALRPGHALVADLVYRNRSQSDLRPVFQELKKEHRATASTAGIPGMVRDVSAVVRGRLEATMLCNEGSDAVIHLRLSDSRVEMRIDGRRSAENSRQISAALSNGVWLTLDARGRISGIRYHAGSDRISRSVAATVASLLQLAAPEQKNALQWEAEEEDQTGRYLASYRLLKPLSWRKEKRRHLGSPSAAAMPEQRRMLFLPEGGLLVRFNSDRTLRELSGDDILHLQAGGHQAGISKTGFSLRNGRLTRPAGRYLEQLGRQYDAVRDTAAQSLAQSADREENNRLLYSRKLGALTLADLLGEMAAAEKAGAGFDDTELYLRLKALIYLQPHAAAVLAEKAVGAAPRSRTFRLLVSALAAIGHREAQQGILTIITSREKDRDTLVELLPLLGMFERPEVAVETAVRDFAYRRNDQDVTFTAQLALGSMAAKLAITDRQRAQRLIEEFLGRYSAPVHEEEISRLLLVLGNAAMEQYLPVMLPHLKNPRVEVRVDAVHALRHFPLPLVGTYLMDALTSDRDASVRYEAANALGYQKLESGHLDALRQRYAVETVPGVRSEMVKTLWKFERQQPGLRDFVRMVARQDVSEDVRKVARGLVGE